MASGFDPNAGSPYAAPPTPSGYPPQAKPGKVQAIAVMTLVGGIFAVLLGLAFTASCVLLVWPGTYYSIVLGIMAIIKGAKLLGSQDYLESPPRGIAIMQIINIINADVTNLVLGILTLVFLNDEEVRSYYRG